MQSLPSGRPGEAGPENCSEGPLEVLEVLNWEPLGNRVLEPLTLFILEYCVQPGVRGGKEALLGWLKRL